MNIGVNLDNVTPDTTVIIRNVLGYRKLEQTPPDNIYKFIAPYDPDCNPNGVSGETNILFQSGAGSIKVKNLSFNILINSSAVVTVLFYNGGSTVTSTQTPITGGNKYECIENITGFDKVVISYTYVDFDESRFFVLDKIYMPSSCPTVSAPAIGTITQPTCTVSTGSVVLSGLPSGSWTINPGNITGSTSSFTVTNLNTGTYNFRVSDSNGCTSAKSNNVVINVQPLVPGAPAGSTNQSFCGGATVADLAATGTAIKWYTASTGGTLLSSATTLVNGTYYYASQTVDGCESTSRLGVSVTVTTTPAPTGDTNQSFCGSATIASLIASGTSLKWYTASTGGTPLNSATSLVNGTTYYASQTISSCESTARLPVTVTITAIPSAPTGGASQSFCSGTTVANLTATGTDIKWYSSSSGGTQLAPATILVNGTSYYASQTAGGCESTSRFAVAVTINSTPSAPTGNAAQNFCGSATVEDLTATGTSVKWYTASTGGSSLASSTALATGTNYYASQTIGTCESTNRLTVTVTLYPLPDVSIGAYGPYCIDAAPIILTGNPTDGNGDWSGPGITDNNDGTAIFNPSVAGTGIHTVTYSYTDSNGCPNSDVTSIEVQNDCPEVVCTVDLSGSMTTDYAGYYGMPLNQQRIAYAKRALTAFTDLLNANFGNGIYFGLAGFKNAYTPFNPAECKGYRYYPVTLINNGNLAAINSTIASLSTGFRTPLLAGLDTARNMFQHGGNKAIVLFSDGAHNCPDWIHDYNTGPYYDLMSQISGISIHTIGFGSGGEVDLDLLSKIASDKGGIFCDLTNGSNSNMKPAYVLDPSLTASDAWDAGAALDQAYSNILTSLGLTYIAEPIGIINRGATAQFDIPVSVFDTKICFFISWVTLQPEYLKVKIRTSDNAELPSDHPDISFVNRDNYTIVTVSGSYLTKQDVVGTNPWKLELSAADITGESEKFQYFVMNKSKELNFNTWFDKKWYLTGDRIKIFLELLAGGQRLNPINKTGIIGTMPVKGLGNLMTATKVTQKQLEELKHTRSNIIPDDLPVSSLKARLIENARPGILSQRIKIKGLLFNDEGLNGDEKAGDGIYTAQTQKLKKEGLYSFNISASDTSKGKNIGRENQLSTFVRVKVKPGNFIKGVSQIDTLIKGEKLYKIRLKLKDQFGNMPSPNSLRNINLSLDKGVLIGNLQSNPDGSFTQMVLIPENIKPADVKIMMKAYDQEGVQRLKSRIPWWIYIGGICVILVLTGAGVNVSRKRNRGKSK
ncbi:MAG: hypothetical protein A2V64_08415 [Bacteroidetes bacterium RBG_13_43_22]|nr:MAG: hypothetical protein A2V64_08415 [Bacteroidetes bacterium RBG_13_43_22]